MVPEILEFALERHGKAGLAAAWKFFAAGTRPLEDAAADPDFDGLFLIWFLFDWRRTGEAPKKGMRKWPATAPAEAFLAERGTTLPAVDRQVVQAALDAPFSFHVVESVAPGESIGLRDVLSGVRCTVRERSASQALDPGGIIFTKVLTIDGVSIMLGAAHWLIPSAFHNRIIDVRQQFAGEATSIEVRYVKRLHAELVEFYGSIAAQLLNPAPPKLHNTDGDPIAPTRIEFELRCSAEEAVDRLARLAFGQTAEDILEHAERDAGGRAEYVVPWLIPANRMHPEWDNTSLGTIRISTTRVEAEVNSERRARRLRKEIERRLRDQVMFSHQETTSIEALLRESNAGDGEAEACEDEALRNHPEVKARLREMEARHWDAWLDQPVPALGGQTPRAAAGTALGRERLEALLSEFEFQNQRRDPDARMDMQQLRRALGMDRE